MCYTYADCSYIKQAFIGCDGMGIKRLFAKIKYELLIFSILLATSLLYLLQQGSLHRSEFAPYYVVDFSLGFCSRFLIGSIVKLLTDMVTETWLFAFVFTVLILTYLLTAVVLGRLLRKAPVNYKLPLFVLILFFISFPLTIQVYVLFFALMDMYWYVFALLAFIVFKNSYLRWLVPLFCFFGLASHYAFLFTFLPLILAVLFFEAMKPNATKSDIVLFSSTTISSFIWTVYFYFYANNTVKITYEQFYAYMQSRVDFLIGDMYFEFYIFGKSDLVDDFDKAIYSISSLFSYVFDNFSIFDFTYILLPSIPLFIFFIAVWAKSIKLTGDFKSKLSYIVFLVLPLTAVPALFTSSDDDRWIANALIAQFALLFYMIYHKNKDTLIAFDLVVKKIRKNPLLISFAIITFFAMFASWFNY